MSHEAGAGRSAHGSYVQLSTFDDKENEFVQVKPLRPSVSPHQRFLCTKRDVILVSLVAVGVCILVSASLAIGLPRLREKRLRYYDVSFPESPMPLFSFDKAAVVTDARDCAKIGKIMLNGGGTAVDAAIATLFCDGVVNPQSMGLGGGFFMTVYLRESNSSHVVDARETAPLKADRDMFNGNSTLSSIGGLSIAVPGELRGYWEAHKKFGKLPWRELIEPAINFCTHGFKVSPHLAKYLEKLKDQILDNENMRKEFFNNATNDVYKEGEIIKRPTLAITLNEVADKGADVLYSGDLQQSFLEDLSACGSIITKEDLTTYKPKIKPAVQVKIGGPKPLTLHTNPLPGSGVIVALILNVLSNYNMSSNNFSEIGEATLMYHRIIEAFKFAFAERTRLGDEDFANVTQLVEKLKSKEYAESLFREISDEQTYPSEHYKPVMETSEDHGTALVSVVAENGDAVTVTSSINTYFGSLCLSPSTGIILNNGMDDFSSPGIVNYFGVPASPANYISPGKRPLSSMSPTIAVDENGDVLLVVGGVGGTRIITTTAMGMIRALWLEEDIKKATDAPHIHHQLFPNTVFSEFTFPKVYADKLKEYGHSVEREIHASAFYGIFKDNGKWTTNVNYRKGGSASGY